MNCQTCGTKLKTYSSRRYTNGRVVYRRMRCPDCGSTETTYTMPGELYTKVRGQLEGLRHCQTPEDIENSILNLRATAAELDATLGPVQPLWEGRRRVGT